MENSNAAMFVSIRLNRARAITMHHVDVFLVGLRMHDRPNTMLDEYSQDDIVASHNRGKVVFCVLLAFDS